MRYLYLYWFPFLILYAFPTFAIDRGEIIDTAYQYYTIQWTPDEYNTGEAEDCWYHNYYQTYGDTVNSWPAHPYCDFTANISYIGEAYAYGWWDTHSDFKDWITYYVIGAGNHACHYWNYYYETGIASPDWTTGIDCSGFVSKCWQLNRHYSTSELANYGDSIDINQVDKGDIIVKPGRHVYLVDFNTGTGSWAYHAVGVDYIDGVGYISRPYRVSYDWIPFDAVPSSDGWCARSLWQTGVEEYYIQVNSPNGGEVWYYDETHNITWDTGTLAETPADSVVIHYSKDGGSTYPYRIAKVVNSSGDNPWYGSYSWTIPRNPSTACKVRVRGYFQSDPYYHDDASGDNFTIKNPLHLSGWMECINPPKSEVVPMDVYHFRAHLWWTFNASYTPYRYGLYRKLYLPQPGDPTGWTRIYYGQNKSYVDSYDFNIPQGAWYYVRAYITGAPYIQSNTIYLEAKAPCPFLYAWNGRDFVEDNNILSGSGNGEPVEDWYKMREKPVKDGNRYRLQLREENNEHSFLDRIRLIAIDHPDSVEIFVTPDGRIIPISSMIASQSVTGENGMDYTSNLLYVDNVYVEADEVEKITAKFGETDGEDYVILAVSEPKPELKVEKANALGFEPVGFIKGRENPSYEVLPLTVSSPEDVSLRFTFTDVSQRLDYIRFGKRNNAPYYVKPCPLVAAIHSDIGSVKQKLFVDDENYAELLPGDTITLEFEVISIQPGWVRDFVFVSNGYYITEGDGGSQTAYNNIPMIHFLSLYPNPARNDLTIRFGIPVEERVSLKVYDVSGREVKTLVDGRLEAGYYDMKVDGKNLPSGIYFARLKTDSYEKTKKIVILR